MNGDSASPTDPKTLDIDLLLLGLVDDGADALIGEDLQQQHVRHRPVEDVSPMDAVADRVDTARDLRDHPAADRSVLDQCLELVGRGLVDQTRRIGRPRDADPRCR